MPTAEERLQAEKYTSSIDKYNTRHNIYQIVCLILLLIVIVIGILSGINIIPKWSNAITVISFIIFVMWFKPLHPNERK